jgi:hypothetical protein
MSYDKDWEVHQALENPNDPIHGYIDDYLKREEMPVRKTKGGGYRYGNKGKTYTGKGAKAKATKQGQAIRASQAQRGK